MHGQYVSKMMWKIKNFENQRFPSNDFISKEDFSLIRVYKGILSMQGRAGALC